MGLHNTMNATRIGQDYERVLFAFRDNALQNYVEQNPIDGNDNA